MTTGPILSRLSYLAIPIIGSQALQMLYNLTDMFWLGRLGSAEVAAAGAAGLYMWMSVAFMLIGSIAASIGVSQAIGQGDRERAKSIGGGALCISLVLGLAFGLVMYVFREQMTLFFDFAEQNVHNYTKDYLSVVACAIPLTFISATLAAIYVATGDSRTPFICNGIGTIINIILSPIFIFILNMGMIGAAFGTIIAQAIACMLFVLSFKKGKKRPFETMQFFKLPQMGELTWILKKALPVGAESLLFTFLVMVTSRREAYFGADAMAMSRVGSQIESLTWLVGGAFGTALISFVGQNFGAHKHGRVRQTFKTATFVMIAYGAFVAFLLAVPGKYIFGLFLPDPELIERSILYLRILAICQIPLCLEAVSSNMFRGMGKTMPPAIVNTSCNIIRVPLAYILSAPFLGIGLPGVWMGISISAIIKGAWSYTWYYKHQRVSLDGE